MKAKLFFLFFILAVGLNTNWANEKAPYPTDQWPKSSASTQGMDGSKLKKVVLQIKSNQSNSKIDGLIIVKNGYILLEEYFNGYHRDKLHTMQSVSKSFTSALIGIALDKGTINNVNQKVLDFFPNLKDIKNLDKLKKSITLKDLLTMRSGTDYNESGPDSPHWQLNNLSRGWDKFYLNRPMINKPGTHFLYDSGGVILMSAILNNLTKNHADKYADKYLFPSLEIKDRTWFKNLDNHPHTGGGLNIRPIDMAKFGLLYLREGKWKEQQVVSKKWIKESFKMQVKFKNQFQQFDRGYGYLWWILKPAPKSQTNEYIYAAKGYMGQYIFLIPEYDLLVVFTGSSRTGYGMRKPIKILYNDILSSLEN